MRRMTTRDADFETAFETFLNAKRDAAADVGRAVADIIADVREKGDAALIDYTARFDRFDVAAAGLGISADEIARHADAVDADTFAALKLAAARIRAFHERQVPQDLDYTDDAGLRLGYRWTPVRAAGLYVPGGTAAYPSSVLMNAVPAKVAGVSVWSWSFPRRRRDQSSGAGGGASGRRSRNLPHRRRPGGGGAGLRHRDHRVRWTRSPVPATPMWPRPNARCSEPSAST
jgi:histidinol dehydrogenase